MFRKLLLFLVSINFISLLFLKQEVYLTNSLDCLLNLLPIFNLFLMQHLYYVQLLIIHLLILVTIFFQSRFAPVLLLISFLISPCARPDIKTLLFVLIIIYWMTLFKVNQYNKYKKTEPYPPVKMRDIPCPTAVIEAIEGILRELNFEVRCLKLCYNQRLVTYYFQSQNSNLLMNLSGYFLKSDLIHFARIVPDLSYKDVIKIEVIYGEDKLSNEEIISWAFENNSGKVFMSFGKDAENKVFVEKLSNIAVFGRTASGKTNFLHQIITSLLRNERTDKIKLFLVNFNNEFIQYEWHQRVGLYSNKYDLDQMVIKLQKIMKKRIKNNAFRGEIVVIVDNFELLSEELNDLIIQSQKHQVGIFFIISTNYIYNDFLKQNFSNKLIFKLRNNLEKQYLAQKNLPNESLMNFDDCFYVNQSGDFRVQVGSGIATV